MLVGDALRLPSTLVSASSNSYPFKFPSSPCQESLQLVKLKDLDNPYAEIRPLSAQNNREKENLLGVGGNSCKKSCTNCLESLSCKSFHEGLTFIRLSRFAQALSLALSRSYVILPGFLALTYGRNLLLLSSTTRLQVVVAHSKSRSCIYQMGPVEAATA
ncbi:hypothetical protein HAX54_052125 [Datura stramonium]|uniref:Uncharacterized protein n=1 Tax=Datura stramonium TaxID=4076 RepID=A0ABS8RRL8_DATST|nr:hypothetical protein [Datura stramonium]